MCRIEEARKRESKLREETPMWQQEHTLLRSSGAANMYYNDAYEHQKQLEEKLDERVGPSEPLAQFLPEFAAYVINRMLVGKDGIGNGGGQGKEGDAHPR